MSQKHHHDQSKSAHSDHTDTSLEESKHTTPQETATANEATASEQGASESRSETEAVSESSEDLSKTQEEKPSLKESSSTMWARAKSVFTDKTQLPLTLASIALFLSIIALIAALCWAGHHHHKDHRYRGAASMERTYTPQMYSHGYMTQQVVYPNVRNQPTAEPNRQNAQSPLLQLFSQLQAPSTSALNANITRSHLSEVNGKVTGSLTFKDTATRNQTAEKLQKSGIKVQKQGENQLSLESSGSVATIQKLLR